MTDMTQAERTQHIESLARQLREQRLEYEARKAAHELRMRQIASLTQAACNKMLADAYLESFKARTPQRTEWVA